VNRKIAQLQETIAAALNAMPGVFSTVQWGGRAYKVGTPKKFKLLTHICLVVDERAVGLGFKLKKDRAAKVVDEFDWITPHSFRTLASSGWLEARVWTKSQAKVIVELLNESRELYPAVESQEKPARNRRRSSSAEGEIVVQRLDAVIAAKRSEGWRPAQADEFDH
jgi:hypothetical protein